MIDERPSKFDPNSPVWKVALVLILCLAAYHRLAYSTGSLWLDELHTSWTISDRLENVGPRARLGNNHPFYFYLMWGLSYPFGQSEFVLRMPSILAGLIAIGVCFEVIRRWTEDGFIPSCIAGWMACDVHLMFFATEARSYALVQLSTLVSSLCFLRYVLDGQTKDRVLWLVATSVSFYLHYTAILVVAGQMGFLLVTLILHSMGKSALANAMPRVRHLWLDSLILLCIAVLPASHLLFVAERRENWARFIDRQPWHQIFSVLPSLRFVLLSVVVLLPGLLMKRAAWQKNPEASSEDTDRKVQKYRSRVLFCICWALIPCFVSLMVNNLDFARLFFRRYLVSMLLAPYLLLGLVLALPRSKGLTLFMIVCCLSFCFTPWNSFVRLLPTSHSDENWRLATKIIENENPTMPILLRPGLIEDDGVADQDDIRLMEYCRFPIDGLYRIGHVDQRVHIIPMTRLEDMEVPKFPRPSPAVWLLIRGRDATQQAVVSQVKDWMQVSDHAVQLEQQCGPSLGLYRIRLAP